MTLSEELKWRGLVKDRTFGNLSWLDNPRTFYLGADVGSSDSLTVGNLAVYMLAKHLNRAGWKTILLVGGATSLIGDPGGKEEERDLVSREQVEKNKTAIANQVKNLFKGDKFTMVDNYDWFKGIGYLEFLRDVGKHYSVTELVQRDYISARMGKDGNGISYAEFSYSLIQGYDFWHLFKNHGVELQIGGSDQWGNMLSGVPLIRKKEGKEAHALSMPLVINKATGKKFGKSEDGAVWLDAGKTSVYKFYQFWLNVDDEGVEDYLKIYTELDKAAIDKIMDEFKADRASRLAQKTLAHEVTKLVHGEKQADSVKRVSETLFGKGSYHDLKSEDFEVLRNELPVVKAKVAHDLIHVLVEAGLASSNSEARRFLEQKAVSVNGQQVDLQYQLTIEDRLSGHNALIKRGKNSFAVIEIN